MHDDPFATPAWRAALRHLQSRAAVDRVTADVPELAGEVAVLWPDQDQPKSSWDEIASTFHPGRTRYDRLRILSRVTLTDSRITVNQLERSSILLLRVLRGRTELLDPAARDHLRQMADNWSKLDPFEAALLLETVARFDSAFVDPARLLLAERIDSVTDPRDVIPVAYALMSEEWLTP